MSERGGWHRFTALEAMEAGLAVIPVREDGTKAPDLDELTPYFDNPPSMSEVSDWFSRGATGVALLCGRASGGLEMLEFEGRAIQEGLLDAFLDLIVKAGLEEVWERISTGYVEESPSGGLHFLFRVADPAGNQVLARRPSTEEEVAAKPKQTSQLLIETRGQGGYVVVAPSSGHVHETGKPWRRIRGVLLDIADASTEERDELYDVARSLDQMKPRIIRNGPSHHRKRKGVRPGDAYNESEEVQERTLELLESDGWEIVVEREFGYYLRRPGKTVGISATLGYCGPGVLYVFSSSTQFEPGAAHSPFAVLAELEHGGNFSAAAAALLEQGYGSATETGQTGETGPLRVRRASDLTPRRAKFTLGGRLFLNHLNVLAGIGGQNKSTTTCEIAARASRGDLDGDLDGRKMRVLIASAEDAAEEVILPRLIAAGADLDYVVLLDEPVALPEGAARLRETIVEEAIDVVIVDPLVAYLESDVDSHRDHSIRYALVALKEIGEEHAVTSIAVMHLNKSRGSEVYERLSGSVGFFNAARSVLVLTPDPRTEDVGGHRVLWHAKCNAGPLAKPWECRIDPTGFDTPEGEYIPTLRLHFGEEVEGLKLSDGLSPSSESISRKFETQSWLQEMLANGEVPRKDLLAHGAEQGFSEKEILGAIKELHYYLGPGGFGEDWVVRAQ